MKRRKNHWNFARKTKKPRKQIEFDGFDYKDIVREGRNCNPLKTDETPIAERLEWLQLEDEEKRAAIKKQTVQVIRHNEMKLMYEENARISNYFAIDPEIREWPIVSNESKDVLMQRCSLMGTRVFEKVTDKPDILTDTVPEELGSYMKRCRYEAPRTRIRFTNNISLNPIHRIPVYSDIKDETIDDIKIPTSLLFDYIDRNVVDSAIEEELAEGVKLAKSEKNSIKCACTSSTLPMVPCYVNPDCECSNMNLHLQKLQKVDSGKYAEFQAFDPIMFFNGLDTFYDNVGFSCSELCGCEGKCTNNVFFLIEKQLFNFEIFRQNSRLGFEVRSHMFIPAGTPIMEFTGKIVERERLEVNVMDYAMALTFPKYDEPILKHILSFNKTFSKGFTRILKQLGNKQFHVDCKYHGNLSRFLCHSCTPNLEIVRIYQKSFTPAHIRLVLVALDDIFPKIPLTIDYGSKYYISSCKCGTFACADGPDHAKFKEMSLKATEQCFHDLFQYNNAEYKNEVKAIKHFYLKKPVPYFREDIIKVRKKELET